MARFYFTVHDEKGEAADDEGADLPDIDAALLHAAKGARCIMSDSVKKGRLDLGGYIEIEDAHRVAVTRLTYREALTITIAPDLSEKDSNWPIHALLPTCLVLGVLRLAEAIA